MLYDRTTMWGLLPIGNTRLHVHYENTNGNITNPNNRVVPVSSLLIVFHFVVLVDETAVTRVRDDRGFPKSSCKRVVIGRKQKKLRSYFTLEPA